MDFATPRPSSEPSPSPPTVGLLTLLMLKTGQIVTIFKFEKKSLGVSERISGSLDVVLYNVT